MDEISDYFPTNIKLEDVREAIKGAPEFFEKTENDLIIFNYRYCTPKTFPTTVGLDTRARFLQILKRECRGLIFSKDTEQVVARRYQKFFNVGEMPETQPEMIDLTRPYIVLTKYDGQLVTPVLTQGKIRFASKSGLGDVTKVIEERFFSESENNRYIEFSQHWIEQNYTPIFEWCSPKTKVVLIYEHDLMVLTGIRHNVTGSYVSFESTIESASKFGIKVTEAHHGDIKDIHQFQTKLQAEENIEGVVIRFEDDGSMYKVKTNWYFARSHKDKQEFSLNSERSIWKLILDQEVDDALVFFGDQRLSTRVKLFESELYNAIEETAKKFEETANQHRQLEKKDYVNVIQGLTGLCIASKACLLRLHDPNLTGFDCIIAYLKKNLSTPVKLENCRTLLGGIQYTN